MIVVVCELLTADCTDHMVRARLGLFMPSELLLVREKRTHLLLKVFIVLLVKVAGVLFGELTLLLQLKDRCT